MDCNKEEANRAKDLAERKMESKDFVNAKKVAQKAQKLYPDLKDISQMILVCDVHCAAQKKVGNENDWYGILQVEPTADEMTIKKQYRKLALLLHPDKNKLAGASDAFKFVGEAQKVLLDSEKRMMYDRKCKVSGRFPVSNRTMQQGSRPPNPRGVHSWFQNPFPNNANEFMNQQHQPHNQDMQSGSNNHRPTFWTVCPFCSMRYQYYKDLINKTLVCQACKKSFSGFEMNHPGVSSGSNFSQPTYSRQGGGLSRDHATPGPRNASKKSSSRSENQASNHVDSSQEKIFTSDKVLNKKRRRRNRSVESSESSDSESSTDVDEDMVLGEKYGCHSEQNLRRSARSKQKVSYDENMSDDDLVEASKRSRSSESFSGVEVEEHMSHKQATADVVENQKEVKHEESSTKLNVQNGQKEARKSYEQASVSKDDEKNIPPPTIYEYSDPEFCDFDKERSKECFAAGQIWAVYDTIDAMPRFYALINKVYVPGFKLQITWLEPNPDDNDEIKWVSESLPVSCGKFRLGSKEKCEDHGMFSHLVCRERGSRRNSYKIYPRKGETWAIFKNWDINWPFHPQRKRKYEFEFVEILSDYVEDTGIQVAYLGKLKDFACLFGRARKDDMDPVLIPAKEMFKFSHKVPSFRMTGKEGKNVPAGAFELDPASLPDSCILNGSCSEFPEDTQGRKNAESKEVPQSAQQKEISEEKNCFNDTVNLEDDAPKIHSQNMGSKGKSTMANMMEPIILSDESDEELGLEAKCVRKSSSLSKAEVEGCQKFSCSGSDGLAKGIVDGSPTGGYVVPDQVFHDFNADRSLQKIEVGQIWAIYSDEDALTKNYGIVQKIDGSSDNGFELHIRWLVRSSSKRIINGKGKGMPICCGQFKLGEDLHKYNSTAAFSHQVRVETRYENKVFSIFPLPGDVWALYKDWSPGMKSAELEDGRYHIVEVQSKDNLRITVMVLDQVDGYKSIFKPQIEGQLRVIMDIPLTELLRFSHRIPAFRLDEEKEGSLRGFLELDTAAIPHYYFCHS